MLVVSLMHAAEAHAFNCIDSPDGLYVMAAGDGGRVFRSWNGGDFWGADTIGTADWTGLAMRGFNAVLVGRGGRIGHSIDHGGTWTFVTLTGAPDLHALSMPSESLGWLVGDGGLVMRTTDGGSQWTLQASGVQVALRDVRFQDAMNGWAVGDSGAVLRTNDGGLVWARIDPGTRVTLRAAGVSGATVWAGGDAGTLLRSTNGGASWNAIDLSLPASAAVRAIHVVSSDTVYVTGGGGFIRHSTDGGATWTAVRQPVLDAIAAWHFDQDGLHGWAAPRASRTVLRTENGGQTWVLPSSTQDNSQWNLVQRAVKPVRGATISPHPRRPGGLFCAIADTVYRSDDLGEVWRVQGVIPSVQKTNAFLVSPHDSSLMVAAVGVPDRIVRSTNGGATWTTTLTRDFSEYGTPVERSPGRPDTLLFAPEDGVLYRSMDFGATWTPLSTPGFRSPCDMVIVPGNEDNIWLGDGVTNSGSGEVWQSLDGGLTFTLRFTSSTGSEIPSMAIAPGGTEVGIAAQWSTGGVARTTNGGTTWSPLIGTDTSWGTMFAPDDPLVVGFGVFTGGRSYLSTNGGANFTTHALPSANYSLYAHDRSSLLATQAFGIFKFKPFQETPTLASKLLSLASPNGGETWMPGEQRRITWSALNVYLVVVEFQPETGEPWQTIATVPGYAQTFSWTVPPVSGSTARVRVRDVWPNGPQDTSNGTFVLASSFLTIQPAPVVLPATPLGSDATQVVTLQNPGNVTLDVSDITVDRPQFWTGRSSVSIPPQSSDTLLIGYRPVVAGRDTAVITMTANDPDSPHRLTVIGQSPPVAFAVQQNQPNPFRGQTLIRYSLAQSARVELDVFNVQGQRVARLVNGVQPAGEYAVPFGPDAGVSKGLGRHSLPSGIYYYRFRAGPLDVRRSMVLLR